VNLQEARCNNKDNETRWVYCAVRNEFLYWIQVNFCLYMPKSEFLSKYNWHTYENFPADHVMATYLWWLLVLYILESNPHPNLIRTSFCRLLKRKKKLVRRSNPHLSFNRPLPTRQNNWIILDVTNALTAIRHNAPCVKRPFNCQRYKRTRAD